MDTTELTPLIEQLDDQLDDLEGVLKSLLTQYFSKTFKNLPVMDKAKLYVLITYTLESLIFSYLRLNDIDARQHPVFRELTRVKLYFEKIKRLEIGPEQRSMTLDKAAANRFIQHGLIGNDKIDLERAEKEAKERARAQYKAALLAKKGTAPNTDSDGLVNEDAEMCDEAAQSSKSAEETSRNKSTLLSLEEVKVTPRKFRKDDRNEAKHQRRLKKAKKRQARKAAEGA